MNGQSSARKVAKLALGTIIALAIIGALVLAVYSLKQAFDAAVKPQQQQGRTVAFIKGDQEAPVPVYETANVRDDRMLPGDTPVSMICWEDDEDEKRWFRVRVWPVTEPGQDPPVRPGEVVYLFSGNVHNQTRVDHC